MNNYIRGYILLMWPMALSLATCFGLVSPLHFGFIALIITFAYVGQKSIVAGIDLITEQNKVEAENKII